MPGESVAEGAPFRRSVAFRPQTQCRSRSRPTLSFCGDAFFGAEPESISEEIAPSNQSARSTIIFLISAIAFAGFRFFGQVLAQFMIVWQR